MRGPRAAELSFIGDPVQSLSSCKRQQLGIRFEPTSPGFTIDSIWVVYTYQHPTLGFVRDSSYALLDLQVDGSLSVEAREPVSTVLTITPNPASGIIHITLPEGIAGEKEAMLELYDMDGRVAPARVIRLQHDSYVIDAGGLASGIYRALVTDGKGIVIGAASVIIQH